jgi:hypothetical protein
MITHGPGRHDDVANSACGALVLAAGTGRMTAGGIFEYFRQAAAELKEVNS